MSAFFIQENEARVFIPEIRLKEPEKLHQEITWDQIKGEQAPHTFGHLIWAADSLGKTLILEKIEGKRRRGRQKMGWLDGITESMDMRLRGLREMVKNRETWRAIVHAVAKSWTWLSDWTTTRDPLHTYHHLYPESKGMGKGISCKWKS